MSGPIATVDAEPAALVIYDPDAAIIDADYSQVVEQADDLRAYDDETRRMIDEMEIDVAEAEAEEKARRAEAKSAKEHLELKESELRGLIRRRRENRGKKPERTLLDHVQPDDTPIDAEVVAANPLDELWKQYPIARWTEFDLTEKQIEKLHAAGIVTVGDLADYTQPGEGGYAKRLGDIKGIGPAVAERIENANIAFFSAWPNGLGEKFAREKGVRL